MQDLARPYTFGVDDRPDYSGLCHDGGVGSPGEFIAELTRCIPQWFGGSRVGPVWYRGIPELSFSLEPSLLRYRDGIRDLRETERALECEFERRAPLHLERAWKGRLGQWAVMQHHGAPTRLLDWTENALAALYFAVRDHQHHDSELDAVVWVLEPYLLSEAVGFERGLMLDDHSDLLPNGPLPFRPLHAAARLGSQGSAFTAHHFEPQHALHKCALRQLHAGKVPPLFGLRICYEKRAQIRMQLTEMLGAGEFAYFPDLDGLSRELRMREGLEGRG